MIVQGRDIRLLVEREDDAVWHWKIASEDGHVLSQGVMTTRLATQIAVQRAFERRLQPAGVIDLKFTGYRWIDAVGN